MPVHFFKKIIEKLKESPFFKNPAGLGGVFFLLSFLIHLPFSIRYDLNWGGDWGTVHLASVRVLSGHFPVYAYGQDYHGTLETYVTAVFYFLFGPSIELGGMVILAEWSLAIGLAAFLIARKLGPRQALLPGLFMVVGVPFTIHYYAVPSIAYVPSVLIPLVFFYFLTRALESRRPQGWIVLAGFLAGFSWYESKLALPGLLAATISVAWEWRTIRDNRLAWIFGLLLALPAAFLGYLPEFLYKLSHEPQFNRALFADWPTIQKNFWQTKMAAHSLFNAQPIARVPESVIFFTYDAMGLNQHRHAVDFLGKFLEMIFAGYAIWFALRIFTGRVKEPVRLFFFFTSIITVLLIILSQTTDGSYFNARRYLLPAALAFPVLMGWMFLSFWDLSGKHLFPRLVVILSAGLFLSGSLGYQYKLLGEPDQLVDYRRGLLEIKQAGLSAAVSEYGHAMVMASLDHDRFKIGSSDLDRIPDYSRFAATQDRLAWLKHPAYPFPHVQGWGGFSWRLEAVHPLGKTLHWAAYRKIQQ